MDNKIEFGVVTHKEYKIVASASIARKLLNDGYSIVDIKPKRGHERETIFVFKVVDGFMEKLEQYAKERKERYEKNETDAIMM